MQITINLTDPQATSIALDEVIFAQAVTEINLSTIPATETIADGTSLALLTPQGKAMAIAQVASNVATLNTNTIECYEFVRDLPVEAARDAYIVLGSATKPIAIVPVQVARNVMIVTPPTEYAPIYPTAIELQEILAEIEAKRAEVASNAQSVQNIASTFPQTVETAKAEIEQFTEGVTEEIMQAKGDAVGAAGIAVQAKETAQRLVDSINYSFDITTKDVGQGTETFIAPAEKDGITPRLDNNGKDIHGVSGFSGDRYNNARFLLDWNVAMSNDRSFLLAGVKFESNRGMGGETPFYQPLIPDGRIPNFEYSPLYWIGHIYYNDAQDPSQSAVKQVSIPWGKIGAGGSDTIALGSEVDTINDNLLALNATKQRILTEGDNITIVNEQDAAGNIIKSTISATGGGGSVYDIASVTGADIILDATKKFYDIAIADGAAYNLVINPTSLSALGKVVEFRLRLTTSSLVPTIVFPSNVSFDGEPPDIGANSEAIITFYSFDNGVSWLAKTEYSYHGYNSQSYFQDGLILHLDGIENAGVGLHSATPETWVDLTGNHILTPYGTPRYNSNNVYLDGFKDLDAKNTEAHFGFNSQQIVDAINSNTCTVEMLVNIQSAINWSKNCGWFAFGKSVRGLWLWTASTTAFSSYSYRKDGNDSVTVSWNDVLNKFVRVVFAGNKLRIGEKVLTATGTGSVTDPSCFIGRLPDYEAIRAWYNSIRVYNRVLTDNELDANYAIDKERFGA